MAISRDFKNARFRRGLISQFLSALGTLALIGSLIDLFVTNYFARFGYPEVLLVPLAASLWAIKKSWPTPIEKHYSAPDTRVRVVLGDLFAQETSLVIGMSDTFDVATPNIIARNSVQGQFLERIYNQDLAKLQGDVADALAGASVVGTIAKPGNTDRYPLGTVATLQHQHRNFYCLAYTSLDGSNKAHSSIGALWDAMEKLWIEVRNRSNGDAVSIPVLGLGLSGLSSVLPIQDAVRFIILSFMFASRKERVCDELRVVIRASDKGRVDMLEIQDFLNSLSIK